MTQGAFITLEGGEGAGKSTQLKVIVDKLRAMQVAALSTREPGGTPKAEMLREVLLSGRLKHLGAKAEAILFSAARIDHIDRLIKPSLAAGTWVICDRFLDSTRAYQGALGNLDAGFLNALEKVTLGSFKPDLTLILDVPPEIALARARARRGLAEVDRFEAEGYEFHCGLREAYLKIAQAEPERCVVIDAARDPRIVSEAIWNVIAERLLPPLRLVPQAREGVAHGP
jgi:dTMP kinase